MNASIFSLYEIIVIIGILSGFTSSIILFTYTHNKRSNQILAGFVISIVAILIKMLFHSLNLWEIPILAFFPISVELFPAVLFYLFVISLEIKAKEEMKRSFIFLVPGLLFMLHAIVIYTVCIFSDGMDAKQSIASNIFFFVEVNLVEDFLAFIFILLFGFMSISKLWKYKLKLDEYAATKNAEKVRWLVGVIGLFTILALFTAVVIFVNQILKLKSSLYLFDQINTILFTLALYFSTFYVIRKTHLVPLYEFRDDLKVQPEVIDHKSTFDHIDNFMKETKCYRDSTLSLPILANKLNLKTHILSLSIKSEVNMSFREYINSYRIAEVESKFKDGKLEHLTLLGLALESGFNSEASFYRVFKKVKGMTPKEYLKKL